MPFKNHILMKTKWYPQPHQIQGSCSFEFDDATIDSTILPIAFYDEGLGAPSSKETHPENAAFAIIANEPNCFVGSRINNIFAEFRFSCSKDFVEDNIPVLRMAVMPIHCAFLEDYTASDELSGATVSSVLELQTESTDRQGGPLYVATKDLAEKFTGSANQGANTPFLNVDVGLEAVAFVHSTYYDMLQFLTNAGKLKATSGGLQWHELTRNRPFLKYHVKIRPNVKRMNPFTYFGLLIHAMVQGGDKQPHVITRDFTAATQYMDCDYNIRYNEWNQGFNFEKL